MSVLKHRNPETGEFEPVGMGKGLIKSITVTGTTSATSGNLTTGLTNENCVPLYATTPDDYVVYPVDATGNVAIHVRLYNGSVATSRELTATLYYLTPEVAGAMSLDEIGTLSSLATTDKSNLVNAINELKSTKAQIATASYDWNVGALSAGASGYIKLAVSESITVLNLVNVFFNTGNISGCTGLQLTPIFVGNGEFYFQYYAPKAIATGITIRVFIKYQT